MSNRQAWGQMASGQVKLRCLSYQSARKKGKTRSFPDMGVGFPSSGVLREVCNGTEAQKVNPSRKGGEYHPSGE